MLSYFVFAYKSLTYKSYEHKQFLYLDESDLVFLLLFDLNIFKGHVHRAAVFCKRCKCI